MTEPFPSSGARGTVNVPQANLGVLSRAHRAKVGRVDANVVGGNVYSPTFNDNSTRITVIGTGPPSRDPEKGGLHVSRSRATRSTPNLTRRGPDTGSRKGCGGARPGSGNFFEVFRDLVLRPRGKDDIRLVRLHYPTCLHSSCLRLTLLRPQDHVRQVPGRWL